MIRRLFAVALFVLAVSAAHPAHATTLSIDSAGCDIHSYSGYYGFYTCNAYVSGGTGSYVSYTWNVYSTREDSSRVTTSGTLERTCYSGAGWGSSNEEFSVEVTVRDSAGATASAYAVYNLRCDQS